MSKPSQPIQAIETVNTARYSYNGSGVKFCEVVAEIMLHASKFSKEFHV